MHKMQAIAFLTRLSEEITTTVTIGRWEGGVLVKAESAGGVEHKGYGATLIDAIERLQEEMIKAG